MMRYKIEIRNSPGWRNYQAATLGVSVPSPNWQGEKFAAIVAFAAEHFNIIRIDVTDALYRHNFMAEGYEPDQALAQANALGALWLAQHQDIIYDCPVKPQIIRWSEWYRHSDFEATLAAFQRAYISSSVLHQAVNEDLAEFFRRKNTSAIAAELETGKNYLIEELAVITLQARELPSLKIYPGEELKCLNVVRAGLVPEAPKGLELEQFAKIKFDKRQANPAQSCSATKHSGSPRSRIISPSKVLELKN